MNQIKLRDPRKYCFNCKEIVEITMNGLDGYCSTPSCNLKLYSIDTRQEKQKK